MAQSRIPSHLAAKKVEQGGHPFQSAESSQITLGGNGGNIGRSQIVIPSMPQSRVDPTAQKRASQLNKQAVDELFQNAYTLTTDPAPSAAHYKFDKDVTMPKRQSHDHNQFTSATTQRQYSTSSLSHLVAGGSEISKGNRYEMNNRKLMLNGKNVKQAGPNSFVNNLVIQRNAPSIPYKDSAYGYEPLDEAGKMLINVGDSFRKVYKQNEKLTPGPGAYELAKMYPRKRSYVQSYERDQTKRSDIAGRDPSAVGPGSYNVQTQPMAARNKSTSQLGHAAFASQGKKHGYGAQHTSSLSPQRRRRDSSLDFAQSLVDRSGQIVEKGTGSPVSLEQMVQREAVGGKYVSTQKMSKLANNYNYNQHIQPYLYQTERLGRDDGANDSLDELVTMPPAARIQASVEQASALRRQTSALATIGPVGPGSYIGQSYNTAFYSKEEQAKQLANHKQEFGTQKPRFEEEAIQRERTSHMGPGTYVIHANIPTTSRKLVQHNQYNSPLKQRGFDTKIKKGERYSYINDTHKGILNTPEAYSYVDKTKSKTSHNKQKYSVFTQNQKRFEGVTDSNIGPGSYHTQERLDSETAVFETNTQSNNPNPTPMHKIDSIGELARFSSVGRQSSLPQLTTTQNRQLQNKISYIISKRDSNLQPHQQVNISANLLEKISTLHLQNNSKILQTKRGKNNPHHMFVLPKNTKDPSKLNLDKVVQDPGLISAKVAVGTYDTLWNQSCGSKEKDEALLDKIKKTEYNLFKMETRNHQWIERARKDYMSKFKNIGNENAAQFLKATGFDDDV